MTLRALLAERAVLTCLGASAITAVPAALRGRRLPSPMPPAALPIWLLVAGHDVDATAATRILGGALDELLALGLVERRGDRLHATAALAVIGAGIVVCDRLETETEREQVPWPDDSSLHLLSSLPTGRIGAWLDVGTGAAVAPLGAGPRAARVRATDVNPHALARAAQGARLSGRTDLELFAADLLAGAAGTAWDLITFNAPMPSAAPRSTWHHAPAALITRFWAEVSTHLATTPAAEVLTHTAIDADPFALHADRPGDLTIARYTPPGSPGFAITRWLPHAPTARRLVDVALAPGRPYVIRAALDPGSSTVA